MAEHYFPDEIIIQGITTTGKVFRPSDWSERLSGILSSFNQGHRLAYHDYVRPLLINDIRCVAVSKKLEEINPAMFRFLLDFAGDNHLKIWYDGAIPKEEQTSKSSLPSSTSITPPQKNYHIRMVLEEETANVYAVMHVLRPQLASVNEFVTFVNETLRPDGYCLVGIFEEGRKQALAVCGYSICQSLARGKYLSIKDLSTLPEYRENGLGEQLLDYINKIAKDLGSLPIHTDSAVTEDRQDAHRLYFNCGYRIVSYHFMREH